MFSCVQKAYKQTVIYTIEIPDSEGVTFVGIRGNDQPLNWDQDNGA
jgi:putative oxidoreductase